jgi:hypothetical protein
MLILIDKYLLRYISKFLSNHDQLIMSKINMYIQCALPPIQPEKDMILIKKYIILIFIKKTLMNYICVKIMTKPMKSMMKKQIIINKL